MCSRFVLYLLIQIVESFPRPPFPPLTQSQGPSPICPLSVGQHSTLPPDTFLTATKTFVLFSATEAGDEKTLDSQAKQATLQKC